MKVWIAATVYAALVEGAVTGTRSSSTQESQLSKPSSRGFTLQQIKNRNFSGPDGPMAFIRAHMKYAQKLPDSVSKAINVNVGLRMKFTTLHKGTDEEQTGTVSTYPTLGSDAEYAVMVGIGTPPQSIPLNLDTDSQVVNGQALYFPRLSSTSKPIDGDTWSIRYGDCSGASGIVYEDTVQIGNLSVYHQAVESAISVSRGMAKDTFVSGIIGLADHSANTISPVAKRTFFENVRDQLAMPVFTANLRSQAAGSYNFGYINDAEHTSRVHYTPIDRSNPLWKISMSGYRVGNEQHQFTMHAIVDTGTSLMLLPPEVVKEYYARVKGSFLHPDLGMMVFPCSTKVPDFWISIGSYNGRVPGQYVNYSRINYLYCFGGIQSSSGLPFSVLGDVFLKSQFVVFDYGNSSVGFANKKLGV
ncbi:hypothetical protein E4U42_005733 [Claviceps africana]|uniref:Peptidase A1 domain-containing protein n=1 Tax=Claviceps africana TaxID=83212 RepID=A0A8K0NFC9_9HYPO|nr:hypothetical protein E4U42_005733 [Claviceps africana]